MVSFGSFTEFFSCDVSYRRVLADPSVFLVSRAPVAKRLKQTTGSRCQSQKRIACSLVCVIASCGL